MSLLTRPIAVYLPLGRTVAIAALMGATSPADPGSRQPTQLASSAGAERSPKDPSGHPGYL
jgi:hypothetical protein